MNTGLSIAVYVLAALEVLSGLMVISRIGKERKPITHGDAIAIMLIDAGAAVLLVLVAMRLS